MGRWGGVRAVCAFLAFVLGVSLLLDGAVFFWSAYSSSRGRQWLADSRQEDYQDTHQFRQFMQGRLELLLAMGAGGPVYGTYDGSEDAGWRSSFSSGSAPESREERYQRQAQARHEEMEEDKNVLYSVLRGRTVLYRNTERLNSVTTPSTLPEGYSFLLQFDGERVRIWKDGRELEIYGNGFYDYESEGQWYVPGYRNFRAGDSVKDLSVSIAVLDEPQVFIRGSYDKNGSASLYSELHYLNQNLARYREGFARRQVQLGLGAALLVLYILLRRDKARADRALARGTGKIWFEVKILLAAALLVGLMPRDTQLADIWRELTYAYTYSDAVAEAVPGYIPAEIEMMTEQELQEQFGVASAEELYQAYAVSEVPVTYVTDMGAMLAENWSWLFQEYLRELSDHMAAALAMLWGLYLLLVNDWRYNKKPWRHGIVGMMCAWGLDKPIQKRLSRVSGLTALAVLLLGAVNLNLLVYTSAYGWSGGRLEAVWAICTPAALLILVAAAFLWRQRRLWTDLGTVAEQAAAIRAGSLQGELDLPPDHDLHQMADDLNHIQQGLHQAVDQRTRSERMKVELVTNVSHDLKTPLTSIISYAELLEQEHLEPPAGEYVRILSEKAQRLKAMVQDVFEVSKAASGQLPVKLERLDFARLLRQTMADMDSAISGSGLTFRVDIPEAEVPIIADSNRMYRVFQNLIGNALKYSMPGSRVYLTLSCQGSVAGASVKNTSADELRPSADYTARFVRGDESRSDGGSGLGLSIAESFTRACGGTLTVSTEADLFTVTVRFPIAEQDAPQGGPGKQEAD